MGEFNYKWHWGKWPLDDWSNARFDSGTRASRRFKGVRQGDRCRVLCTGNGRAVMSDKGTISAPPRNVLVEFEDGIRYVAPFWAVRKAR